MGLFRLLPKNNQFVQIKRKIAALTPFPIAPGTSLFCIGAKALNSKRTTWLAFLPPLNRNLLHSQQKAKAIPTKKEAECCPLGD